MASYVELRDRFSTGNLYAKVEVAVCVKSYSILQEASPTADRKAWAVANLKATESESLSMLRYLLAANKDLSVSVIDAADDAAIQAKVDEAIDKIYP